nr:MAG TPA: hypothetical protein [Crassvirales sp.]
MCKVYISFTGEVLFIICFTIYFIINNNSSFTIIIFYCQIYKSYGY